MIADFSGQIQISYLKTVIVGGVFWWKECIAISLKLDLKFWNWRWCEFHCGVLHQKLFLWSHSLNLRHKYSSVSPIGKVSISADVPLAHRGFLKVLPENHVIAIHHKDYGSPKYLCSILHFRDHSWFRWNLDTFVPTACHELWQSGVHARSRKKHIFPEQDYECVRVHWLSKGSPCLVHSLLYRLRGVFHFLGVSNHHTWTCFQIACLLLSTRCDKLNDS